MFLSVTTTHQPASDLGFLLHKNPARVHELDLGFGRAVMFYPEADLERCTFALILNIDPASLVRGRTGASDGLLDQYVNGSALCCCIILPERRHRARRP